MIKKETSLSDVLKLAPDCSCEKCSHGCTMGSGVFTQDQIAPLAKFLNKTEEEVKKEYLEKAQLFNQTFFRPKILREGKPYGKCIFYNGKCRIHEVKPLQCKVATGCGDHGEAIQDWFREKYLVNENDPISVREFEALKESQK